jgi:hypothetical protein
VDDIKSVEKDIMTDINNALPQLSEDLMMSKMSERAILAESMANGGPSSVHEAIANMMYSCNIGVRRLAERVNVKRKVLAGMLAGERDMPSDVLARIIEVFEVSRPDLFK